jgi:hypothetical protein
MASVRNAAHGCPDPGSAILELLPVLPRDGGSWIVIVEYRLRASAP